MRPRSRKPTVIANITHSTAIAMSESRALPVIGMDSVLMNMIAGRKESYRRVWRWIEQQGDLV